MIERVARHLAKRDGVDPDQPTRPEGFQNAVRINPPTELPPGWHRYVEAARDILRLMREPPLEMREAATRIDLSKEPLQVSGPLYSTAMIDAALAER